MRYAENRKVGKPSILKVFEINKTKWAYTGYLN
jgi:hypothetical protein